MVTTKEKHAIPRPWLTFIIILGFRIYNSLLIKTFFSPDEYWQSLEVAHEYVFGYGYLTWEWTYRVRGFTHPMLFAAVYKVLQLSGLDDTEWIIMAPKIFQAFFAAIGDIYTYKLASKLFGKGPAKWALVSSLISFFNFFCAVRSFSNSIETSLTAVAMFYWPWTTNKSTVWTTERIQEITVSLTFAAIACILRPTNAVIWMYLGYSLLSQISYQDIKIVLFRVMAIGLTAIGTSALIDRQFYNEWTLVPYTFLKFNLSQGISTFYGVHNWHWYLSQGIPIVLFTFIPLTVYTLYYQTTQINRLNNVRDVILFTTLLYSLIAHKEFRFIMPLLPLALCAAGNTIFIIQAHSNTTGSGFWKRNFFRITLGALVLTNAIAAFYLGLVHQRGVVDVMGWLRKNSGVTGTGGGQGGGGILFLMPCHSTPFYSHLHRHDVDMRFITCEPPLDPKIDKKTYLDESDIFYANPSAFIDMYFSKDSNIRQETYMIQQYVWPSRVVLFQALLKNIEGDLVQEGYKECARFFNSHFHDDSRRTGDVLVYCK
ncbi:Alg9-like mannosyltransferase family-domain-containing protein [Obelidium mucronatum]|nr:Alg9-like mannosyltransferase family-domain-containing protein [Obelidium mucronatum]